MKQHTVPESQKVEYIRILEQVHRRAQDVLPMYFYALKDPDMVRKLIAIVRIIYAVAPPARRVFLTTYLQIYITREQRTLIANGSQKYILSFNTLSTLISQIHQINAQFDAVARPLRLVYLVSALAEFATTSSLMQSPILWLDASMVCVNSSIQKSLHLNESDKNECAILVRRAKIYNVSWKTTTHDPIYSYLDSQRFVAYAFIYLKLFGVDAR